MENQPDVNLIKILRSGIWYDFDCSCSVEDCLSRLENYVALSHFGRKEKQPLFVSLDENTYEFSFEMTQSGTALVFRVMIQGQFENSTHVTVHAKLGRGTWIWILYAKIFALLWLPFIPFVTALMTIFVLLWLYISVTDCRNAPNLLIELFNAGKKRKRKEE